MADDVLVMEARLKDYISSGVEKIINSMQNLDEKTRKNLQNVGKNTDDLSSKTKKAVSSFDGLNKKIFNVDNAVGGLIKSYFSLGLAVFSVIRTIKSAQDAYENYAKAVGGEEGKKILENERQHELVLIDLGKQLEVYKSGWGK